MIRLACFFLLYNFLNFVDIGASPGTVAIGYVTMYETKVQENLQLADTLKGQNIFPQPFSSQILIKKSPKGGHSISGHLQLADRFVCTKWSKTYFKIELVSDMKIQITSVFKPCISNIFLFCFPNYLYKILAFPLPSR